MYFAQESIATSAGQYQAHFAIDLFPFGSPLLRLCRQGVETGEAAIILRFFIPTLIDIVVIKLLVECFRY